MVCFIYREEVYNPTDENQGTAELIIGKQRNGPTGTAQLAFLKEFTRFENMWRSDRIERILLPGQPILSSSLKAPPTWAEINLDNLVHNFRVMKKTVGAGVAIMPAVKADAYGHGAVGCARALEGEGADWFGVALPEEGLKLRDAGITRPILCLGVSGKARKTRSSRHDLTPVLFRLDLLERFNRAARAAGVTADYHLKVDTGMGRLGVPFAELDDFLDGAARFENVRLDGVMTHFASADDPDKAEFTDHQIALFESAVQTVRARGHNPTWIHEANSAAILSYQRARGNMVRPGGVLYGLWRDVTSPTCRRSTGDR